MQTLQSLNERAEMLIGKASKIAQMNTKTAMTQYSNQHTTSDMLPSSTRLLSNSPRNLKFVLPSNSIAPNVSSVQQNSHGHFENLNSN